MNTADILSNITDLIENYKDKPHMISKLQHYISNQLPTILENYEKCCTMREIRTKNLVTNSQSFINRFIAKENLCYTAQNELFFKYTGIHFERYSEDNIHHNILTQITNIHELRPWKYKIKNNILKMIKEKSPLHFIPESCTIQYIINQLYPGIFASKARAKYFLTVIGDNLLHKNNKQHIYISHPYLKPLIGEIGVHAHSFFGICGILQHVKYKYYDHPYNACRILTSMHPNNASPSPDLYNHLLDLLCVASYYSTRYGSADKYLTKCGNKKLLEHATFLSSNTQVTVVTTFLNKCITSCNTGKITSKHMIFIWKKFLDELDIPNIIFHSTLHVMLQETLEYNKETDEYNGITSVYLPTMSTFMEFWNQTIIVDDEGELEIEELVTLFNKWKYQKKISNTFNTEVDIFLDLIKHFHPTVYIEDNKYVANISCSLWNKKNGVLLTLEQFKSLNPHSDCITSSLSGAYMHHTNNTQTDHIVSKRYFEKVAAEELDSYVDKDGIIDSSWFQTAV